MSGTQRTQEIINHLKQHSTSPAMFFITTNNIQGDKDKERLNAYIDAGHSLAHHSGSHLSANRVTAEKYIRDFAQADKILSEYSSVKKYHRFPFLHYGETTAKRKEILSAIYDKGYSIGYVTIDNFDWYINAKLLNALDKGQQINYSNLKRLYIDVILQCIEFYYQIAKQHLEHEPKHVLLLHENDIAALFLGDLIQAIAAQGWTFISTENAYNDALAKAFDPAKHTFNKQGRVASIAHSRGAKIENLRHKSENQRYLDKMFNLYQVVTK